MDFEYIICSAVWHKNYSLNIELPKNIEEGSVFTGRRHSNCYEQIIAWNIPIFHLDYIDGFLSSKNFFYTRKEAFQVALLANQLKSFVDKNSSALISEMLY